ncbi:Serine/threonine-protein phosphatase 2A activator 1 [Lodderomyces elongisporus]|uniref:Serine/threonine-protein phosphatase 2A activator 1 n=1 Tax=Lodderomyces elongisporus TaxID=36914 RepID=UPI0029200FEB|nr:Serine/threonine-protein phosphatase 2A activator 1 [Lodderomyces elongisporus]WLF76347.1 Serine/threonine-protein phosphatase 2A activator 1 [Lodderomyces elongisporus]
MDGKKPTQNPSKKIYDATDLKNFEQSIAFHRLQQILKDIVLAVQGIKIPPGVLDPNIVTRINGNTISSAASFIPVVEPIENFTPHVEQILSILKRLNDIIDETPRFEGPTRFGNIAYRSWHDKVEAELPTLTSEFLKFNDNNNDANGENHSKLIGEATYYLANSFGSKMRLDYGTGHELSFVAFLGGLMHFKFIAPTGLELLTIFSKYYDLARRLILVYNLEPAGSHGVWGLDDHFHLIYILGASQFCEDKFAPSVRTALSKQTILGHRLSNLYVNAVAFIFKLKSGPFHEHSPIISDIHTNVLSWVKVRQGLMKMYMVEVFGKFPVIQHFWFGEYLYPWKHAQTKLALPVIQRDREDGEEEKEEDREREEREKLFDPTRSAGVIKAMKMPTKSKSNIPMTAAPWANSNRFRDSPFTKR